MLKIGDTTAPLMWTKGHASHFRTEWINASVIFSGVQAKNGTYLVGGNLGLGSQRVNVANTTIVFTHNRNRKEQYKDQITIAGPTNAFLRVVVSISLVQEICFYKKKNIERPDHYCRPHKCLSQGCGEHFSCSGDLFLQEKKYIETRSLLQASQMLSSGSWWAFLLFKTFVL